jgi:HSP20 family protein
MWVKCYGGVAVASDNKGNNPFDMLKNLGELRDIQKFLGADFFKNMPLPNMQGGAFSEESTERDANEFPRVDLYGRGNDQIVAVMEIPGLTSSSDVTLSVRSNVLTVRGKITAQFNHRDDTVLLSECHHGSFQRKIELQSRVLSDSVEAVYRSGLLVVYLTKDKIYDDPGSVVPINFD